MRGTTNHHPGQCAEINFVHVNEQPYVVVLGTSGQRLDIFFTKVYCGAVCSTESSKKAARNS